MRQTKHIRTISNIDNTCVEWKKPIEGYATAMFLSGEARATLKIGDKLRMTMYGYSSFPSVIEVKRGDSWEIVKRG